MLANATVMPSAVLAVEVACFACRDGELELSGFLCLIACGWGGVVSPYNLAPWVGGVIMKHI